jgi:acyl-coenzyme A thioesterase PaaI-like protein
VALAVTRTELEALLARVPFTRAYGFRLGALGDGRCVLDVPFRKAFERPGGIVSGQVYMAAADVAMWLALMTRLGIDDQSVTADMTTAFLGAARRETFRCRATVLKLGARLVYGLAECRALDGRLLTHHGVTYIRAGGRAVA